MIQNRTVIIFGDDWGRYPSTVQHIGKVLKKGNTLLWIGSLGLRKPRVSLYDLKRMIEKAKNIFRKRNAVVNNDESVVLVDPFVIPFHDIPWVYSLNMALIRWNILRTMKKLKLKTPILITSSPIVGGIIGRCGETSSHYLCLDDFTLFDGAFENLGRLEQDLLGRVDSCFAISEKLLESRRVRSSHNYFLPQGVDTSHFSPEPSKSCALPVDGRKPIIGFFGLLTTWVNLRLIVDAARRYPEYDFVIIGKTHIDVSMFGTVPNIRYVGEVDFSRLPQYARSFDVGIIPFVINELTIACNPLKLLEYLSMGIPVVSTNMPEVAKFRPDVYIGRTDEEFISLIGKAVDDISEEKNNRRRMIAEQYSWQSIADELSRKIQAIESKNENVSV
jgi:glycosyltransferase involved in cell wall biosynthesis